LKIEVTVDTRNSTLAAALQPAQVAKAALKRLVESRLEPTPENYAKAYRAEGGHSAPAPHSERGMNLLERLACAAGPESPAAHRRALAGAILDGRWELAERTLDKLAVENDQGATLANLIERIVRGVERGGRQWTAQRQWRAPFPAARWSGATAACAGWYQGLGACVC
jgi:diguanylate cyclase